MNETKNRNTVMGILTGISIILIVLGHLDMNELSVFGLFPYYSFHVMVFVFISGYFYNESKEDNILSYIGHKALRLLVPYFICNLIYGIISTVLSANGFSYCAPISLKNFFIEPFLGGHQFGLNFASWFVPALFIIEVINIISRKILSLIFRSRTNLICDLILTLGTLAAGIATVYLAQGGHVWGIYKTPGRILFMLPVYELGIIYRRYLESVESKVPDAACLGVVSAAQFVIYLIAGGLLNFSAVWCTSFASFPFVPYLTIIIGTLFWLRISRIIAHASSGTTDMPSFPGRVLDRIGDHSFHIMMHHVTIFFVINLIMYALSSRIPASVPFDIEAFHSDVVYTCLPADMYVWKIVYLIAGISIPVFIGVLTRRIYSSLLSRLSIPRQH